MSQKCYSCGRETPLGQALQHFDGCEVIAHPKPPAESFGQANAPACAICGEPMPAGESMFKYHGYSGPCPKPATVAASPAVLAPVDVAAVLANLAEANEHLIGAAKHHDAITEAHAAVEQMAADLEAANARIESLRASRDRWTDRARRVRQGYTRFRDENESLRQRAEAAEADAARWRKVRAHGGPAAQWLSMCPEPERWDDAVDNHLQEPRP